MKKKLAFIDLSDFSGWPVGGILSYELEILKVMEPVYDIELWGVSAYGDKEKEIEINGNRYKINLFTDVSIGFRMIPNFWKGLFVGKYAKHFEDFDIIYAHSAGCMLGLVDRIKATKCLKVYHQHGLSFLADKSLKTMLQKPLMEKALLKADLTFAVTGQNELKDYLKKKPELSDKMISVGSPIQISDESFDFTKKGNRRYIYIGRFACGKRVELLLDAFKLLCEKTGYDNRLVLAGGGEKEEAVRKRITKLNLWNCVEFVGVRKHSEVMELLKGSDYYVTASVSEGVSVAVLEAYSVGLPVVCFDVRGLKEQVIHEKTGIIVKGDSAADLEKGMEQIKNADIKMRENCILESSKYSTATISNFIIEKIEEAYEKNQCNHSGL